MSQDALRPGGGTEHWGTVMARSDLLVSLVKAGSNGDATRPRSVAEAIIAAECPKRHNDGAEAQHLPPVCERSGKRGIAGDDQGGPTCCFID